MSVFLCEENLDRIVNRYSESTLCLLRSACTERRVNLALCRLTPLLGNYTGPGPLKALFILAYASRLLPVDGYCSFLCVISMQQELNDNIKYIFSFTRPTIWQQKKNPNVAIISTERMRLNGKEMNKAGQKKSKM